MAELAETRAESQAVKDLTAQIKTARDPEIEAMTGGSPPGASHYPTT